MSEEAIPKDFICVITGEVFQDPVICEDGNTYEKIAIVEWLQRCGGSARSPLTNLPLESTKLIPNRAVKNAIESWFGENRRGRGEREKMELADVKAIVEVLEKEGLKGQSGLKRKLEAEQEENQRLRSENKRLKMNSIGSASSSSSSSFRAPSAAAAEAPAAAPAAQMEAEMEQRIEEALAQQDMEDAEAAWRMEERQREQARRMFKGWKTKIDIDEYLEEEKEEEMEAFERLDADYYSELKHEEEGSLWLAREDAEIQRQIADYQDQEVRQMSC